MNVSSLIGILLVALASTSAYAGIIAVPEPGVFELLAIGGVAAVVIAIRNRRKK